MDLPYETVFCDLNEPLDLKKAIIEANRCYYCYDAPCIQACPTQIDIPSFIRKVSNQNIKGAALDILSANIMGGTCARACPVETLCQHACVREKSEQKPVEIGLLQRFATDRFYAEIAQTREHPFKRAKSTGKRIAVIGAGPAGLACAHKLATLGHDVTIYESKPKSGGLNEYGLAPYKMTDDFAQKEVQFILSVGGIKIEHGKMLGKSLKLEDVKKSHDAVFLGLGLGGVNALGIPGEEHAGVLDAAKQIELIRQTKDTSKIEVGTRIVVIGGGNTAVDIAIQMKRLGAAFVTIAYRRGQDQMGATRHEQELAQKNGVMIQTWVKPESIARTADSREARLDVVFERTELSPEGTLRGTGLHFTLQADQVFKAIGQNLIRETLSIGSISPTIARGKIVVDQNFQTTIAGIFAGGDCIAEGEDLTVTSVQQGKQAALAIDRSIRHG